MLKLIKTLLQQFINDIDSGNSYISETEQEEIINLLQKINIQELTKIEAANYIVKGLIPKGHKRQGQTALGWNKSDLDKFNKLKIKKYERT